MSWKEGFYRAVGDYLDRTLPDARPHRDWGKVAEIIDITEGIDEGAIYDTGADIPEIELTITWRNTDGERHTITEQMSLSALMRELSP